MVEQISQPEINNPASDDPRWRLVERIVASPSSVKSDRLCSFLLYICELSLQGRHDEINEVKIGAHLFGRPNYNPSSDGIVRSHASRLRQRLEQYFSSEGCDEPFRLVIPKGSYIPFFEDRKLAPATTSITMPASRATGVSLLIETTGATETRLSSSRKLVWTLGIALSLACAAIVCLLIPSHPTTKNPYISLPPHPLWSKFFIPGRQPTLIVCADSSLAIVQDFTEHNVSLSEYLNSDYRIHVPTPNGATTDAIKNIAMRRYTSIVDMSVLTKIYRLHNVNRDKMQLRYARDLRLEDLKDGSAILLGAQQSNPWVEMFEPHMNFVFRDDLHRRLFSVVNRSPQKDELPRYDYDLADPAHKVYGVAALRPNLSASAPILILEGTSMAGTEAAADFVFDDALFLPFLKRIRKPDGSLPYFEVLLESGNMNGNASEIKILGYRISSS